MAIVAAFDQFLKTLSGMTGYFATLASTKKNIPEALTPMHNNMSVLLSFQCEDSPPRLSPSNVSIVTTSSVRLPNQSIALRPGKRAVLGLWMLRQQNRTTKVRPEIGRFVYLENKSASYDLWNSELYLTKSIATMYTQQTRLLGAVQLLQT